MTTAQKEKHNTVKNTVDVETWSVVKYIRGRHYMFKAAVYTAEKLRREEFECIIDLTEKQAKYEEWARENMLMVRHFINRRRNYVATEIGDTCVDVFLGGDGKGKMKKARGSARNGARNGDKGLDLSNPNELKQPVWLPTAETIVALVMRDPEAWGYNDKGELVSDTKQKKMDGMLAFYSNMTLPKVCGQLLWSPTKRCYVNISTGRPNPTDKNPNPGLYVTHSSEAVAVWMIENHINRWKTRAKCDISHPEELKHKKPDGTFLDGLEDLQGKCTCPSGGRQPHRVLEL